MRIIALASALLLLGASAALGQSATHNQGSTSSSGSGSSSGAGAGAAAAVQAATAAHSGSSSSSSTPNPLTGATAGAPSVNQPVPQTTFTPPQVLVNLSDGYPIPEFGTQLFSGSFAGTRPADRPDYLIQPGDQVVVNLYGAVNSGGTQTVDASGNVFIIGVGPVHVGGVAVSALQPTVSQAVGRVFTGAVSVYATVSNAGTIGVYVSGDVMRPGRYIGGSHDSILYYLNQSQGIDANGTYRAVTIRRSGQVVATYDLYDFLLNGVAPTRAPRGPTKTTSPSWKRNGGASPFSRKS